MLYNDFLGGAAALSRGGIAYENPAGRRRLRDLQGAENSAGTEQIHRGHGLQRRRRPGLHPHRGLRRRDTGHHDAGKGRPGGAAGDPRRGQYGAGAVAVRPGRAQRPGHRAGGGGGRLSPQALRGAGASGPGQGAAAAQQRLRGGHAPGREPDAQLRGLRALHPPGVRPAEQQGIPADGVLHAQSPDRVLHGGPDGEVLGLGGRGGDQRGLDQHRLPAPEAQRPGLHGGDPLHPGRGLLSGGKKC